MLTSSLSTDRRSALLALMLVTLLCAGGARAERVNVAVAANFTGAAMELGHLFEQRSGHAVAFSFGSTGQLYAQITQGAPFDVYLAADAARPMRAAEDGYAVPDSRFTYATGRIALFSRDEALVEGPATLRAGRFATLAIANPVTAPYGAAAVEALHELGVFAALEPKIVRGTNIAQAYQFVETGNAELGFVALSQIATHGKGSRWLVPEGLHSPIAQDAVLLRGSENKAAARDFMAFLESAEARRVMQTYGYGPGD